MAASDNDNLSRTNADSRDDDGTPPPTIVSGELSALRAAVAASRGRRVTPVSWRRRARQWFTPERMREFATTLALVVPLTVLIWVWAEREEVEERHRTFYVDVRSTDPNKSLTIEPDGSIGIAPAAAAGGSNPGTGSGRIAIDLKLRGPRSSLDALFGTLANDTTRAYLTLDVSDVPDAGRTVDLVLQPLINQQALFSDVGASVESTTPEKIRVDVDRMIDEDVPIRLPADLGASVQSFRAEPATVHVRGPERTIARLKESNALVAEVEVPPETIRDARPGVPVTLDAAKLRPMNVPGLTLDAPAAVRVSLQVTAEESGYIQPMAINVSKPSSMTTNVRTNPLTLPRVHIVGRADLVRRLVEGRVEPKPYAEIVLTPDDIGKTGRKTVKFRELPAGVRVPDGEAPEIEFDATDRAGGTTP